MGYLNKVVLVTGGGTGIGRATAMLLAERGAIVAINYSRSAVEAEETAQAIRQFGGRAMAIQADVARNAEVVSMIEQIVKSFGTIHYLVNNASITRYIAMDDLEAVTEEAWDDLFAVNVKGMFNCARAAAPYLKAGKGAIVNVGSIAGITGKGSSLPYAVSKAAVHGLTKSLAHALAPDIRVTGVAPGAVDTRWWAGKEEQMRALIRHLPLDRISTPEEIAALIAAVLEQPSLTGQIVTVDNGQTM
ncbi:SDR family oxidoreductase [Paenibacillus sp. DXFW5]|uniref:SDR family oxidoreductase n=1 Tax=Paenibacillus rhizolycopersici TaxID=2780073 RepID=A0ABS2H0X4_9BACL|nr:MULTISPECIES: SDR family oxidoreductase [Paenibacillus]MBM6995012.1 SDR family oxidoreductase [Paenibacillus rhizolycopersici]MUG85961.1 SDR family NAD(P)-dependent oxidoreductase [Paenibacillus timonensis]